MNHSLFHSGGHSPAINEDIVFTSADVLAGRLQYQQQSLGVWWSLGKLADQFAEKRNQCREESEWISDAKRRFALG